MRPVAVACLIVLLLGTACGKYGPPVRAGEGHEAVEEHEAMEPEPDEESGVVSP